MFAGIVVKGVVQGVGFRPFVYHLANKYSLTGFVANTPAGVHIEVSGLGPHIDGFVEELAGNPPPTALIKSIEVERCEQGKDRQDFSIHLSSHEGEEIGPVAPDMDVCDGCLAEFADPSNRRFQYPFINCTDCGPRFTLIKAAPYDREQTSMRDFPLCSSCAAEYADPGDRRFHAQATCCADCGPQIVLTDNQGQPVTGKTGMDHIGRAADLLKQGKILAVKGIGGFHLAANGTDQEAVQRLRERKGRPEKPLAVMVKNEEVLSQLADITKEERKWLCCRRKPVVLLAKNDSFPLAVNVAPDNAYIGVMLPYTPLHHLLLGHCDCVALVMTSANLSGEPIVMDNQDALEKLAGVADFFLLHDREIITGNDDSVIRLSGQDVSILRRSRSFTPEAITIGRDCGSTLALGAIQKNTICLTRGDDALMSQHIGDLDNLATIERQEQIVSHYSSLLRIEPDLLVHDMHPDYAGTHYAEKQHLPTVAVQHHHAHAVSCMAEHRLAGPVIAVTLDGSGYGPDHTVWGGEVLVAEYDGFQRAAHLDHVSLPGNEAAIRQPWRMAFAYLYDTFGHSFADLDMAVVRKFQDNADLIITMIDRGVNSPVTSSCGRLFDAIAAMVGLRYTVSYEGQAAALLEMAAGKENDTDLYPYGLIRGLPCKIDCRPLIKAVCDDIMAGAHAALVSRRFHNTVAAMFAEICTILGRENGIRQVVLSGGVFQNMLLSGLLRQRLAGKGFEVFTHQRVPANDGGIALGQAVAGRAIYESA